MKNPLPTLFIGSSSEALHIARAAKRLLSTVAKVTLWDDRDAYQTPGGYFLDALVQASAEHDFALLVFAADDKLLIRDHMQYSTRDNVVFELGLFWSRLGRERTFVMTPTGADFRILSDLQGLTLAEYPPLPMTPLPEGADEHLKRHAKAVIKLIEGACGKIAKKVVLYGPRELSTAPRAVFEIAKPLGELMHTASASGQPVVIRNIGLDMEQTWGIVRQNVLDRSHPVNVTWHTLMADADSQKLRLLWSNTFNAGVARQAAANIQEYCAENGGKLLERNVNFSCRTYAELPPVHGFLFNDSTVFISLCGLNQGKLQGSPSPYLRFDRYTGGVLNETAAHMVSAFSAWFEHHWTDPCRLVWPVERRI